MLRTGFRRAVLVSLFAVAALAAGRGSVAAYPSDDHDGDFSAPNWSYANPAAVVARDAASGPTPEPWFDAGEHTQGGR